MRLTTRILLGLLTIVALMVFLGGYQLQTIRRLLDTQRRLAEGNAEALRITSSMGSAAARVDELEQKYAVLRDPEYRVSAEREIQALADALDALRRLHLTPSGAAAVAAFGISWRSRLDTPSPPPPRAGAPLQSPYAELGPEVRELTAALRASLVTSTREAVASVQRAQRLAAMLAAVAIAVAVLLAAGVVRWVVRPLLHLQRGTRAIADGDLAYRVRVEGSTELLELAEDFNAMASRLAQVERLKEDFVASVSHDLKAPLAAIRETMLLMLEKTPAGEERQRRLLELSLRSAARLTAMVDDLLDVTRLEAGVAHLDARRVNLVDLVAEVLHESESLLGRKELELRQKVCDGPAVVRADVAYLQRAVGNLVQNAIKYSPANGRLGVVVERVAGHGGEGDRAFVELEVWDEGPGIPDEEKERIFDRFHQVRREGARPREGTGLGLAIVRSIVEAHRGRLWVEDRDPVGSRFRVRLPAESEEPPGAVAGPDAG